MSSGYLQYRRDDTEEIYGMLSALPDSYSEDVELASELWNVNFFGEFMNIGMRAQTNK
jgi:hypothetical protein